MRLLFATHNRHKVEELQALLLPALVGAPAVARLEIVTLADLGLPEPVEDGDTLEANARIKARAAHAASGLWSLADDSGLLCDALGDAPGVQSAYYAGLPRSDERNRLALLQALEGVEDAQRGARFRCILCLVGPDDEALRGGALEGRILREARGEGGFGYDPLFVPAEGEAEAVGIPVGLSLAELRAEEKNRLSHRARAMAAMVPVLINRLGLGERR